MEQRRIEIIYQMIITGQVLTKESLIANGFTEEDINLLMSKRIIIKNKDLTYEISAIEKLRQYGVKLLQEHHIYKANACFEKCYELAPTGRTIALQYLLAKIIQKDYQNIFEIYENAIKTHPELHQEDNNLYLFLLSNLLEDIPDSYKEKSRNLTITDILLPDTNCNKIENEIRTAIGQHKFKYAYQLLNVRNSKQQNYSIKYELIRALVSQIVGLDRRFKSELFINAKESNYLKIIEQLEAKQQIRQLSKLETSILIITKEIIKTLETGIVPIPTDLELYYDLHEAIKSHDFKLALHLNQEYLDQNNDDGRRNTVYILLTKLNNIINEIELSMAPIATEEISEENLEEVKEETSDSLKELKEAEELAYYITSSSLSLAEVNKKMGILPEQILLIKLVYARDYYIESNYEAGDRLLSEILSSKNITPKVMELLNIIKNNKYNYNNQFQPKTRKLTIN